MAKMERYVVQLDDELWFPDPHHGLEDGWFAIGGDLSPNRLILAYQHGIFPWYSFRDSEEPLWFCPMSRFVIFPSQIHVSHSMRTLMNKGIYHCSFNKDFDGVIRNCGRVNGRYETEGAWLSEDIIRAYTRLHKMGWVSSVEVWEGDQLVGGLYGGTYKKTFIGESMFSLKPNTSKIALIFLARYMEKNHLTMIDCQIESPHLKSMGGVHIDYEEYMRLLNEGIDYTIENVPIPMRPGAREVLDYCKKSGYLMAIATSTHKKQAYRCLENAGIFDYFDHIITGDQVSKGKPDPDVSMIGQERKAPDPKKLRPGDSVFVKSMNLKGTVMTVPDSRGFLQVRMGILNSKVNVNDLELIDEVTIQAPNLSRTGSGKVRMSKSAAVSMELNLLGKTVDEAVSELDKYLDDAYMAHLPSVRIVHGKGTGALRKGVHDYLRRQKKVASFRLGEFGEGDAGVTIVKFKD